VLVLMLVLALLLGLRDTGGASSGSRGMGFRTACAFLSLLLVALAAMTRVQVRRQGTTSRYMAAANAAVEGARLRCSRGRSVGRSAYQQ
jgi:hypothetical protein